MRNLLLLMGALILSYSVSAQITLSNSNVTGITPGHVHAVMATSTGVTAPTTGANQTWDYSTLKASSTYNRTFLPWAAFSATAVLDSQPVTESVTKNMPCIKQNVYDIDANGIFFAGANIPAQGYSIAALSGNQNDSTIWAAQSYKIRQNYMKFPATMSSAWTSNTVHSLNFTITVTAFGVNKAPVKISKHEWVHDTVAGWGKVMVPSSHNGSIGYDALMVQRHYIEYDSMYVGGGPAPAAMLNAFSTKQNDTLDNHYYEYFYRPGSGLQILIIDYGNDATYSKPKAVIYDADNVASGIEEVQYDNEMFKIYPNPATSGFVNFQLNKNAVQAWNMTVVNPLGQLVKSVKLESNGDINSQIDMTGFKSGLYFVNVRDENGNAVASSKFDLQK